MGNTIGGRRKAKVMKITGEIFKVKTPIRACDILKEYPGHVLLNSDAVNHFGVRAKPLEPQQELRPKKIYFLIELPKFPEEDYSDNQNKVPRRVRSGIQVSAKDRLECLMLSRRSVSDLTSVRAGLSTQSSSTSTSSEGMVRLKMRLPRAQMDKLDEESKDDVEVAERIIELYMASNGGNKIDNDGNTAEQSAQADVLRRRTPELGSMEENNHKARQEKRVSFVPMEAEGEIRLNL